MVVESRPLLLMTTTLIPLISKKWVLLGYSKRGYMAKHIVEIAKDSKSTILMNVEDGVNLYPHSQRKRLMVLILM